DLEDSVPLDLKQDGRLALKQFLQTYKPTKSAQYMVRINSLDSEDGQSDLAMLVNQPAFISTLLIPKLESVEELIQVGHFLEEKNSPMNLFGIIETAKGLEHASLIANAHSKLKGLYFGGFDLSTAIGCEMDWEPLLYSRSKVVHAAALGGIFVFDSPAPFVDTSVDQEKLFNYCLRSKGLGMMGMVTKHGSQVSTIKRAFSSSAEEIERAEKILAMYALDPSRPIIYEGKLIELPMIKKLRQLF
ncbi:MAG: CoA ester lyase, partial [Polynucleobacter sp.]|nr:CoA ester lyase [Polynucleobacter sp.]